ncbi:protein PAT1 homolog 1 [Dendroctonus ponderosae]|uniref:mRNA decay factor PAT1 domain-containing protein n=3 Tax=Dendroctonus ponderosae TaxID=77166 RepID=A0AAR5PDX5_DENPD|nr:protein PAT1 homolog 1 [Dendroctonus ponderosae]
MADSFFEFDTSLKASLDPNNGEPLLPDDDDDDGYENEEAYDALNDETFGTCEQSTLDDWEQQHEQFAEIKESSRLSDKIENSISQLVLDKSPEKELLIFPKNDSVWAYNPTHTNGDSYNDSTVLSSLQKASKSFIESHTQIPSFSYLNNQIPSGISPLGFPSKPAKICTVEELEKNLIKNSRQNAQLQGPEPKRKDPPVISQPTHMLPNQLNMQQQVPGPQRPFMQFPHHPVHPYHPLLQHPNSRLPPPGLPPLNVPPPNLRHIGPPLNGPRHIVMPPGYRMIPPHPHLMPPNGPPGYIYPIHMNHIPYNYPPPPHMTVPMPGQQNMNPPRQMLQQQFSPMTGSQQQNHSMRNDAGGTYRLLSNKEHHNGQVRDDYAGLMTPKDKQWLLNIQMMQVNTGTPYFDDYYYTIYKERKSKSIKEHPIDSERNSGRFQNNGRQRRNSERQDGNNLTPRVYTVLQFENSLGKLQCGSVTAPRKIIDMEVMQSDKEQDIPPPSKDSKKTKQYLLEIEALYSLLLKAEDINNPMYVNNMEKYREMKQKQRLRELEQAPTPEQKQEVLRLFKQEANEPITENKLDYILKICSGFFQEEKISSFLNIRKGKMFLLRLLPHLSVDLFSIQLQEIWTKVLLSLPVIGRRDTAGDNILPKLYPYFKQYVQTCTMEDIIDLITGLMEEVKLENNRSTPLGHAGKAPLYFVVLNKLGVSALVILSIRVHTIMFTTEPTEEQLSIWLNFLIAWAKHSVSVSRVAVPLEAIPSDVFAKHVERFAQLPSDRKAALEKFFVDVHIN